MVIKVYKILVRKPEVEIPLRRPRCRLEDIRMDLKEITGEAWSAGLTIGIRGFDSRRWL